MSTITQVAAHQILDSRGSPTVEVHLALDNGMVVTAPAPSGASIGKHEAEEKRDHQMASYMGLSVQQAIASVNQILAPALVGKDPLAQGELDQLMIGLDATPNKSKLGANAIIATSIAIAKAGATVSNLPIYQYIAKLSNNPKPLLCPTPMFNIINGGLHGTGNLDIQEFMIVPAHRLAYSQALEIGDEVYLNLKEVLVKKALLTSVGDEGGFTPTLFTNASALDLIFEAAKAAGYNMGQDAFIALDVAADQLKHGDKYFLKDSSETYSAQALINFYQNLIAKYQVLSIEDPFAEDDWAAWHELKATIGSGALIVGDDLTVTNPQRVQQAIAEDAISALIVKPNQIGTISEALQVVDIARQAGLTIIVSHRSGETEDTFIADFAVGVGADYFKGGAPARGERVAKYNRFIEIEAQLATKTA